MAVLLGGEGAFYTQHPYVRRLIREPMGNVRVAVLVDAPNGADNYHGNLDV
jgi:hypothetical protein